MMATKVPPASPWSSQMSEARDSERHIVTVTFSMQMTNLGSAPAKPDQIETPTQPIAAEPMNPGGSPATQPSAQTSEPIPTSQPTERPAVPPTPGPSAAQLAQATVKTPRPLKPPTKPLSQLAEPSEQLDQHKPIPPRLALSEPSTDLFEVLPPDISEQLQEQPPPAKDQTTKRVDKPTEPKQTDPQPTQPQTTEANPSDEQEPENKPASVYDEDSVDQPIAFDKMARPKPPAVSVRLGETGTVRVLIEVDETGRLLKQTVLEATEYPRLLAAALSALDRSTFHPAEHKGGPVHSTRVIEYRF